MNTLTAEEQATYKATLRAKLPAEAPNPRAERMLHSLALIAQLASPEPQELSIEQRLHSIQSICETAFQS